VTHLQYADDTMVLTEPSTLGIANLKLLLLFFEDMLGLKINFDNIKVFVAEFTEREQRRVANMLNCKLGKLLCYIWVYRSWTSHSLSWTRVSSQKKLVIGLTRGRASSTLRLEDLSLLTLTCQASPCSPWAFTCGMIQPIVVWIA
jgi:hypothetical protein